MTNRISTYLSDDPHERVERALETVEFCNCMARIITESGDGQRELDSIILFRWSALAIMRQEGRYGDSGARP